MEEEYKDAVIMRKLKVKTLSNDVFNLEIKPDVHFL